MKKRLLVLCCAVLLALGACLPAGAEREIPQCLRFRQKMTTTKMRNNRNSFVTVPETALPEVDSEIAGIVDRLYAAAEPYLADEGVASFQDRIDAGPYITRVGDRWMSFLTVGRVTHGIEQVFVAFDARVYNMETGERVTLDRIIDAEKGGWEYLSAEVSRQLDAHFPLLKADEAALDALCAPEALKNAAFTLSPGHITLHWHAHDLYPDAPEGLLRVTIYYPDLKPFMTETAITETDCTGYPLAALTYDDGPGRGSSDALMNQLRLYGAEATFFNVGERMHLFPGVLHREYDAGYSVQSHNWIHDTKARPKPEQLAEWIRRSDEELSSIIGIGPTLLRPPGGNEGSFIKAGASMPLIHWSSVSGDMDASMMENSSAVAQRVIRCHDGDIILCHDMSSRADSYALIYLPRLTEKRGFLLVTVEDLCVLRGVELLPGQVYTNCPPE